MFLKIKTIKKIVGETPNTVLYEIPLLAVDCGEIPLSPLDSCRLLLLNLSKYIENKFTPQAKFNKELFIEHTKIAQRLMDDLVDLEEEKLDIIINKIELEDPEPLYIRQNEIEIWKKVKNSLLQGRRTGLGMNAVGDAIAFLGMTYGSEESLKFIDDVFYTFRNNAYLSSIEMARDLGAFPVFDSNLENDNEYLNRLWEDCPDLKLMQLKYGRRNISLLTLSPSGSISCLTRTSSGVEPVFRTSYIRRKKINDATSKTKYDFIDQNGIKFEEFKIYHAPLKAYLEADSSRTEETSPWFNSTSDKINWVDSVKMQSIMQNYIDHSISRTVNLPSTATHQDIYDIYMAAWKMGCKGITVYRDGSRSGILVTEENQSNSNNFTKKNDGVKRPEELKGEVHHLKIKDEEFVVIVGLMENQPYEIFINNVLDDCSYATKQLAEDTNASYEEVLEKYNIPKNIKSGKIIKIKRGVYKFISDKGVEYVISGYVESDEVESLARMVSLSLRHKIDLSFVVHGLEKNKGYFNFPKAMARTLKKYIPKGTKVSGEACPNCGGENLMRQDGCVLCGDCGWSKC